MNYEICKDRSKTYKEKLDKIENLDSYFVGQKYQNTHV